MSVQVIYHTSNIHFLLYLQYTILFVWIIYSAICKMISPAKTLCQSTFYNVESTGNALDTNVFSLTDILHSEAVILVEVGDVVLAAELNAVRDPHWCVVHIEEALPVWMDVLWTLFPFTGGRPGAGKQWWRKEKKKTWLSPEGWSCFKRDCGGK